VVDKLVHRQKKPNFIFASPNIPNPQVYLRLMLNAEEGDEDALAITYSPVVQIKFLVDLKKDESRFITTTHLKISAKYFWPMCMAARLK
jgi:hypothetical protein